MNLSRTEKTVNQIILVLFAVFAVVPLLGVVLSSITPAKQNSGGFNIPTSIDLHNYGAAWNRGNFSSYLLSSVVVTAAVVLLTVTLATLAGYAFARMRFPGSSILFYTLLLGLTLPAEAFIIPLYFNLRTIGLTDTYWALILPQTAQSLGFAVFWMRNQFRAFPPGEIIEAARLDGSSDFRLLWRIVVPPSLAPMMTMAVIVTMWTWNEFLLPLVLVSLTADVPPSWLGTVPGATPHRLFAAGRRRRDGRPTDRSALLRTAEAIHQRNGRWHLVPLTPAPRPRTPRSQEYIPWPPFDSTRPSAGTRKLPRRQWPASTWRSPTVSSWCSSDLRVVASRPLCACWRAWRK